VGLERSRLARRYLVASRRPMFRAQTVSPALPPIGLFVVLAGFVGAVFGFGVYAGSAHLTLDANGGLLGLSHWA
jgi:hypothetical protein